MNRLLIGNILGFAGSTAMVGMGLIKRKKLILLAMCLQYILIGSANFFLGGYGGTVTACFGIAMNLITLKYGFGLWLKLAFSLAEAAAIFAVNSSGFIGMLPLIPSLMILWTLDTKNETKLKAIITATLFMWAAYDFNFKNYTTLCFDAFAIASNIIGLYRLRREKLQKDSEEK